MTFLFAALMLAQKAPETAREAPRPFVIKVQDDKTGRGSRWLS